MIRVLSIRPYDENRVLVSVAGNAGDAKPTDVITGSTFLEVDTGIMYAFDEESGSWIAQDTGNGKTSIVGATVTLGSNLTYDGTEKTKSVTTVKISDTTLTENTDYIVKDNKAVEPGNYTLRIVGIGSYAGYVDKEWSIAKASGSVSASPDSLSLEEGGDAGTSTLTVTGDGAVSIATSDATVATAVLEDDTVTVTPVGTGSATITITLAASEHYTNASETISVTVAAAENDTPAEQGEG